MPKLPIVSGIDVIKALSKIGYKHTRTKGSHAILNKQTEKGKITIPVPLHKELGYGLLNDIIKQSGYTREEFLKLL